MEKARCLAVSRVLTTLPVFYVQIGFFKLTWDGFIDTGSKEPYHTQLHVQEQKPSKGVLKLSSQRVYISWYLLRRVAPCKLLRFVPEPAPSEPLRGLVCTPHNRLSIGLLWPRPHYLLIAVENIHSAVAVNQSVSMHVTLTLTWKGCRRALDKASAHSAPTGHGSAIPRSVQWKAEGG